ncbi:MAG: dihydrouridine synthase [Bacteroidetes bacterium GWE2_41_25]|nr:MAG: dihydrouridine synthase [Bacteroidetes bacterium GWA2_40_15]OFX92597.1 MAG: dihydrouridine synthase [Bacteroidetes bacterium GWE2_41_25]HCT85632.1 dihydrouridine synthase [Candidatus Margulisiibacteriota bacterium]
MLTIHSSPLQGFTDFRFRNTFQRFFGGIDRYIAPYIQFKGKMEIKPASERDILPENNSSTDLIPQIITKDADEFIFVAKSVQKLGYTGLNWNLGCPYPMIAKRGMGAGLLSRPEKINEILNRILAETDIQVSVKMRLGYESPQEIFHVLPVLERYSLSNITIHPRIGKQMYSGEVDLNTFEKCLAMSSHKVFYNGDITSVGRFREMKERFPKINHCMIGRGLIADPFLPSMIKADNPVYPENRYEVFSSFHDALFSSYEEALSGQKHLLMKMYSFWVYFIQSFSESPKGLKKIKKAQNLGAYREAVRQVIYNL